MRLRERRIRSGRYEWRCRCGRWYWKLASHIHRFHLENCTCKSICLPLIQAGGKNINTPIGLRKAGGLSATDIPKSMMGEAIATRSKTGRSVVTGTPIVTTSTPIQ